MQSAVQQPAQPAPHVDPQSDPHDAIVALLRGNESASAPRWSDPSELNITATDSPAPGSSAAPPIAPTLPSSPLNEHLALPGEHEPPRRRHRFVRFLMTVAFGVAATVGWQA